MSDPVVLASHPSSLTLFTVSRTSSFPFQPQPPQPSNPHPPNLRSALSPHLSEVRTPALNSLSDSVPLLSLSLRSLIHCSSYPTLRTSSSCLGSPKP
ncbi:hypothetical protein JAAARDRAFT_33280 [Jaapia argillacea MUCL 33604]|uniref:Uncharacterized protein n=1 Tax=Jaapia argillacea MUCL 33604 TaxID=933084 RepID=A0A067Q881_9AGAM|nr:hypothetical protein JAAARDRAFT_33280 [Jaapia argillacea MUCL 33604]